jgi:ribulose-5-phosphate 4-epimerase/fuculose-1-phosphate aldolase
MRPLYSETTTEVGPVPVVPNAEPLTKKLARNFKPFLNKYDIFIMRNHGRVTMSREGIKETLMKVELLEMSARSILLALQAGKINELDRKAVRDLSKTMRTRH